MLSQLLIVEDDPHLGPLLRDYLSADYQVFHAATLAEAQNWLGTHSAQLILLDLNLPDGNGLDLVQSLRQYSSNAGPGALGPQPRSGAGGGPERRSRRLPHQAVCHAGT